MQTILDILKKAGGWQTHRVAVLDRTGRPVEQYNADHSGGGLVTLVNILKTTNRV